MFHPLTLKFRPLQTCSEMDVIFVLEAVASKQYTKTAANHHTKRLKKVTKNPHKKSHYYILVNSNANAPGIVENVKCGMNPKT